MVNIYEILQRAASLKEETALNSISPERAGGIMYDTLLALNDLWLQQGSALVLSKIYASVAAMEADTAPVSDLTGKPLRPGQIVVIASSDSDNGSVYRYNGADAPSWSLVGAIGNLTPVDSLDSDSTTLSLAAHQGKVLDGKISQLGQEVDAISNATYKNISIWPNTVAAWGGADKGAIQPFNGYTSLLISCKKGVRDIKITGATPLYYFRYSGFPSHSTYMSHGTCTEGQFIGVTDEQEFLLFVFADSSNLGGYGSLKVIPYDSEDFKFNEIDGTLKGLGVTKLQGYAAQGGGPQIGHILETTGQSCMVIPIVNKAPTQVKIFNAVIQDNKFFYYSGTPSKDTYLGSVINGNNTAIIPSNANYVVVNFADASNPNGYDYLDYRVETITPDDALYYESEKKAVTIASSGTTFYWLKHFHSDNAKVMVEFRSSTNYCFNASIYALKAQGTLSSGYSAIVEGLRSIYIGGEKAYRYYFTIPEGYNYIMANFSADESSSIDVILRVAPQTNELGYSIFKNLATNSLLLSDKINEISAIKANLTRDEYVVFAGDSICAFQSSVKKAVDGVTRVPATCDKQANAYHFWNAVKWGDVQIRRFDDGKASLVGDYDNRWTDDSEAFFTESGTFYTQYARDGYQASQSAVQITTHIDTGHFSTLFDQTESALQQRNIPKRFSNGDGASISFTIPSGYKKFDLLYHAHIDGDTDVSVSVSGGNGKVRLNTKPNDWGNAIEANGATLDLSLTPWQFGDSGNDAYGTPNKRIHFEIINSDGTTITITKSSNTSKYLIYQGVEFWGTTNLPFALHIDNMAAGGYTMQGLSGLRQQIFRASQPTFVIFEMPYNDVANIPFTSRSTTASSLSVIKGLLDGLSIPLAMWVPHFGKNAMDAWEQMKCNYQFGERLISDSNAIYLGNIGTLTLHLISTFYNGSSLYDFMNELTMDGVHPNNEGFLIFKGFWQKILR